jgi:septum site-determining protein MinD
LPASQTDDKDVINEEQFKSLLENYKSQFQFILIDSPAGIEQGFRNAASGVDGAVVVTTPEVSSIRDADRVVGLLAARGVESLLVVNRLDPEMVRRGDMLSLADVQDILGVDIIGVVERDESVIIAANNGEPVVFDPKSRAGRSFSKIARRLMGEDIPIENPVSPTFWQRLSRTLGV